MNMGGAVGVKSATFWPENCISGFYKVSFRLRLPLLCMCMNPIGDI